MSPPPKLKLRPRVTGGRAEGEGLTPSAAVAVAVGVGRALRVGEREGLPLLLGLREPLTETVRERVCVSVRPEEGDTLGVLA